MTKKDKTELYFVIDASGSMCNKRSEVISGFNAMLEEQAAQPGEVLVTVMTFEELKGCRIIADRVPAADFRLNTTNYRLGGMTPLYEACIRGIESLGKTLATEPENARPDKVGFIIATDGLENSSDQGFTKERLQELIKQQSDKYAWNFIFLGQDIDAGVEGAKAGVKSGTTAQSHSFERALKATSANFASYRSSGNAERLVYSDEQRESM